MNKQQKVIFGGVAAVWFVGIVAYYLRQTNANIQVLNPKGIVAHDERNLIIFTVLLGLLVVVPVYVMTFAIAWKYREANHKARYRPDWDHNSRLEALWWGIPTAIILVLSVVTWNTSHSLNPPKPLSSVTPMHIQVVALDWKWLFIYPTQGVASVNYVQFPTGQPVEFDITSNGPMNSFWIPQLGSQIYAMVGMSTHLNLQSDASGDYRGSSANISGRGFAGMHFTAHTGTEQEFNDWASETRLASPKLSMNSFKSLAKPSENNPQTFYALATPDLYNKVLLSFQLPGGGE